MKNWLFRSLRNRWRRPTTHRLPLGRNRTPVFELLELRAMLSGNTYSPTDTNDDGTAGALRAAIATANVDAGSQADTIQLSSGTYMLTFGELDITNTAHSLVIDGQGSSGPNATVIDQLSLDRVFQIAAGASVTFENVEITGGIADDNDAGSSAVEADGGGILSDGNLTLNNVVVSGNKALATVPGENAQGGGVYATGSLTVLGGSLIEGNSAVVAGAASSSGGYAAGGGVFSSTAGLVNISGSTIANNAALGGASASSDTGGEAVGGGIYISNSGTPAVVLNDDTITGNQVVGGTGGAGATGGLAWGGGVAVDLASSTGAPVTISNSTLSYNLVQGGDGTSAGIGGDAYGGAADIFTGGSQLLNDTVYGNSATGGSGATSGNGFGGGIIDDTGASTVPGLSLVNVTVAFNAAQAGIPTLGGTAGTSGGGGIDNDSGDSSLAVSNSLFAENTAAFGPDVYGAAATTDHNLVGIYDGTVASGFSSLNGDQLGTSGSPINPLLGQLQNNGGNTATAALLAGSPAINAGDTAAATAAGLSTDQRGTGFSRIVGAKVDVGAYETQASVTSATTLGAITSPTTVGQSVTLSAGVSAAGSPTGTVTFEDTVNGITTSLGSATLTSGTATLNVVSLPQGSNSITAVYSGDATFNGSSSAPRSVVVNLASGTSYAPAATAADGTTGSLRAAVALANAAAGSSTIVLSPGVYSLTQGELEYSNTAGTLTIIGQGSTGPNATVINQLTLDRVLNVDPGATVVLENVEITGGVVDTDQNGGNTEADGGGILVNGSLTLSNSAVSGNRALALGQTNAVGGAIYVTSTGSLTVTGSTPGASQIDNNSSIAAAGASGSGQAGLDAYAGGIMFSAGTSLQFTGTTLANNAALGGAGGSGGSGVAGGNGGFSVVGGFYVITGATTTAQLSGDTIANNVSQGGVGGTGGTGAEGGIGGDVFTGGLAIDNEGLTPAVLSSVTISNNLVLGGAGGVGGAGAAGGFGGDAHGGGAYLFNGSTSATPVVYQGNTFSGNIAIGGAGGAGASGGGGGAASGGGAYFDVEGDSSSKSQSETFSGNTALGGIGGAGAAGGSDGTGGIASGGGVYISNITTSVVSLTQDTITGNQALGASGASTSGGNAAFGGGVVANGSGPIQINNTTVTGNSAVGGAGDAGVTGVDGDDGTAGDGDDGGSGNAGGIYLYSSGATAPTLTADTINSNVALGGVGGAGASGGSGGAGGNAFGGGLLISEGSGAANVSDTLIASNTATGGAGGAAGNGGTGGTGGGAAGGGFLSSSTGTELLNSTLYGNTVTGGGGFNAGSAYGGGIEDETGYNALTGMSVVNVTIASNVAQAGKANGGAAGTAYGGGFDNNFGEDLALVVDNTLVANNKAETSASTEIEANGPDFYGQATTALNNLINDASGITTGFTGNGNQLGPSVTVVPGITGAPANNGGPTATLALAANSTARGTGSVTAANAFNLTTDQRGAGFSRIVSGAVDIGAFETQSIVVTPSGTTNTFTVGGAAVAVDAGVTVTFSGADLTGATVTISTGTLQTGDTLHFTTQNGITGVFASGVLTLSGTATPAQYQTALRSVTFSTTSTNITTRSISIVAVDNSLSSGPASESVKVALATPAAPVVTPSGTTNTFTVGGTAVAVDAGVTVTFSGADLTGATVTISTGTLQTGDTLHFTTQNGITGVFASGVLTLSGTATPAQYQAALQSVTFSTTSTSTTTRAISIVATDNSLSSTAAAESVKVALATPAAPVVTPSGTTNTFTVGGAAVAVDAGVTVTFSGADLTGATVTISTGTLQTGDTLHFTNQNGITGVFASGVLTLSGTATPAQYQAALQSVTFSTTSTSTTTRAISIVAADNSLSSTAAAESVKVALATPAAPVVTPSGTTNTFTVGGAAVAVDAGVTVTFSGADLTGATVTISTGTLQTGDTLHFTTQNGITGVFASGVLTLSGTATPAQYQAALQSVTFSTTSTSTTTRAISIVAADNSLSSGAASESVKVALATPAAPVVTPSGTTNTFTVGGTAVAVDAGVTVTFSGADLTGATVTISTGTLQTGDTLHFTTQNGITGVFASGVLTLSGTATPAQYQAALQSVTFSTTSTSTTTRAISIVAADNSLSSTAAAESVKVAPAVTLVGPSVTNAVTTENTQTTSGLVIKPGTGDSAATYFQITAITGGTLYQNNGTTAISSGSFITLAQGAAGLKFTPTTGSLTTGSFQVQESTSSSTAGLGGAIVTATITVSSSASGQPVSLVGAYNLTGITIDGTKFTGGLDGGGHAISETLIGTSQTWNGVKFNIAAAGTPDVVQASGQTLSLPTGSYAKLELLATGVNGNQVNQTFTVHYTDGTSTTFTQSLSDWHTPQSYSGQSVVLSMSYRNTSTGAKDTAGPFDVYGYTLTLNSAKTVQSITLPNNHNVAVLAMTVVAAVPVAAPTNLKATVVSSKEADLSWTAAAGTITGYNVYRGTTSGGESSTPLNSSPLPAGTTSYHDTTVVAGNTYYYVVKAIDGSATSASSNEVVAKITSGAISSTPVSLTGAYSLTGITVDGAKFSGGLDGGGHALSESLVGPSQTWNGVQFNIAPAGAPNVIQSSGQTFILPEGSYSKLELLATGVNGNQANQTFTVRYTDGTTTTFTQSLSDWHTPQNYAGESVVLSNSYRNTSTGTKDTSGPFDVYGYAFTLNPAKTVVAITLPNDHNVAVLAMSLVH